MLQWHAIRVPSLPLVSRLLVALVAVATIVAIAVMWPSGVRDKFAEIVAPGERATVVGIEDRPCGATIADRCKRVAVRVDSGDAQGTTGVIQWGADGSDLPVHVGDEIRVTEAEQVPGYDYPNETAYQLTDFQRGGSLLLLAGLFVGMVVLFSRWRGVLSLLGLIVSLAVILLFVVPGILSGEPPVAVAVAGSLAVMLATILLAHGFGTKAVAALLGTTGSLLLTALLAVLFTDMARLTGFSGEATAAIPQIDPDISLQGILVAGMIIAALGVLDDVTVSQSSTVLALRAANPGLGFRELCSRAMHVGRDHVGATVNTLVLAYAGASLPVLLIFASGALSVGEAVNLEVVAEQIVGMLVGSIGLIAAVPLTTAVAALLALHTPRDALDATAAHGHAH